MKLIIPNADFSENSIPWGKAVIGTTSPQAIRINGTTQSGEYGTIVDVTIDSNGNVNFPQSYFNMASMGRLLDIDGNGNSWLKKITLPRISPTIAEYAFVKTSALVSIDLSNVDFSNCSSTKFMIVHNSVLKEIDCSNIDLTSVGETTYMFGFSNSPNPSLEKVYVKRCNASTISIIKNLLNTGNVGGANTWDEYTTGVLTHN
jgi:hypothetical protein